jgi:dipeptidyl aminopeptidase/acylaminoacyl peptidase
VKRLFILIPFVLVVVLIGYFSWQSKVQETHLDVDARVVASPSPTPVVNFVQSLLRSIPFPLSIASLREQEFTGSDLQIEQELGVKNGYSQYVASYVSEGNKIYGLLTVPLGARPISGWPVIIFNHGYIPPKEYTTTERYGSYVDGFARNGYIVFKSDYRGHGESEGEAVGGYGSNAYTIDVLNALASLRKYPDADPNRIGMWGHSMGGFLTLRAMVVDTTIKAGVIWGGVVAPYEDIFFHWRRATPPPQTSASGSATVRRWRDIMMEEYGSPSANTKFWDGLSANSFLSDISGPIQLHHAKGDAEVPYEFSEKLHQQMHDAGKDTELYLYEGDNHNISGNFNTAMRRSIAFFDAHVKEAE